MVEICLSSKPQGLIHSDWKKLFPQFCISQAISIYFDSRATLAWKTYAKSGRQFFQLEWISPCDSQDRQTYIHRLGYVLHSQWSKWPGRDSFFVYGGNDQGATKVKMTRVRLRPIYGRSDHWRDHILWLRSYNNFMGLKFLKNYVFFSFFF